MVTNKRLMMIDSGTWNNFLWENNFKNTILWKQNFAPGDRDFWNIPLLMWKLSFLKYMYINVY